MGLDSQYIYQDSKFSYEVSSTFVFFPGWTKAEIKCTVHVALPKLPINQSKLDQKSRKKVLRHYCANIYTVPGLVKAEISINQEGNSVLRIKLEYIYKYMRFFS